MLPLYDESDVVFLEVVQDTLTAHQFETAFGQRFVSLIDLNLNVYGDYQAPFRVSPYPLVYVLDANGVVRYWATEYEPAAIVARVDELLSAVGVERAAPVPAPRLRVAPNPVVDRTTISFRRQAQGSWEVSIFDVLGRRVRTLRGPPGPLEVSWSGRGAEGRPLPGGVYFLRLTTDAFSATGQVTLRR